MKWLALRWLIVLSASITVRGINLDHAIEIQETNLKVLASRAERLVATRCSAMCTSCSYHACTETLPDLSCEDDFETPNICEKKGNIDGIRVSGKHSTLYTNNPRADFSDDQKHEICALSGLDGAFKDIYEVKKDRRPIWQGFGSESGYSRIFPGRSWSETCSLFDPRSAPWYVSATTGPKNIVLMVDNSNSQSAASLDAVKTAFSNLIDSLSFSDWVGIVAFNAEAISQEETLLRGSVKNKSKLKRTLNSIERKDGSDLTKGINETYSLLKSSLLQRTGTPCRTVIIIASASPSNADSSALLQTITDLDTDYEAQFLLYSLGTSTDETLLKQIACAHRGLWKSVDPVTSFSAELRDYYVFLASEITQITHAVWQEVQADELKQGDVTTGSYPVYDTIDDRKALFGVVKLDIQTKIFNDSSSNVFNALLTHSTSCFTVEKNECILESLRADDAKCNICQDTNFNAEQTKIATCQGDDVSSHPLCGTEPVHNIEELLCCEPDVHASVSEVYVIVFGGIVVAFIFVGILQLVCRKTIKREGQRV
mmetsp:Transcript_29196/g.33367  ORF Transcript_29196/g.33367 Transcript_29196/m.33367 type:complete len:542 (-) Transcript_29196:141-1766(-)